MTVRGQSKWLLALNVCGLMTVKVSMNTKYTSSLVKCKTETGRGGNTKKKDNRNRDSIATNEQ